MTAKEKLKQTIEGYDEAEAAEVLELLDNRPGRTSLDRLLESAPIDDEPETEEERRLVEEGREDFRRGDTITLEELRQEFG